MFGFIVVFRRLLRSVKRGLADPGFRGLLMLALIILAVGMVFYHRAEGWTLLQSLYFSVITLTTVGYGDFSPATSVGRLFTIFYVLAGVGIIVALVSQIASHAASDARERREQKERDTDSTPPSADA